MSKRIRDLVPLGLSSTIQISGRIASTTPEYKIVVPSVNVLSTLPGGPFVIVPGNPAVNIGNFSLPDVNRIGGCYVIVNVTGVIASLNTLVSIVLSESSGHYAPYPIPGPAYETGVAGVYYLLVSLDVTTALFEAFANPGPVPPLGTPIIQVWAACDVADTFTVNSVGLGGDCIAAIPIQVI